MVNVLKFEHLSFCSRLNCCIIRASIHKIIVRIGNREEPDQTAYLEAV